MKHIYSKVLIAFGFLVATAFSVSAQNYKSKFSAPSTTALVKAGSSFEDNPAARAAYNRMRLVDPETGEIPGSIFMYEKEFAKKLKLGSISLSTSGGNELNPWIHRGPFNVGGRTRGIGFDVRSENILLAGGVSGGIFRSTDFGNSWSRVLLPWGSETDPPRSHDTCRLPFSEVVPCPSWRPG